MNESVLVRIKKLLEHIIVNTIYDNTGVLSEIHGLFRCLAGHLVTNNKW